MSKGDLTVAKKVSVLYSTFPSIQHMLSNDNCHTHLLTTVTTVTRLTKVE